MSFRIIKVVAEFHCFKRPLIFQLIILIRLHESIASTPFLRLPVYYFSDFPGVLWGLAHLDSWRQVCCPHLLIVHRETNLMVCLVYGVVFGNVPTSLDDIVCLAALLQAINYYFNSTVLFRFFVWLQLRLSWKFCDCKYFSFFILYCLHFISMTFFGH